jgi:hypothetical protein
MECMLWIYGLRCLQLRAHGFGMYSLSRLSVKLERVGLALQRQAAVHKVSPREYVDSLREAAELALRSKRSGRSARGKLTVVAVAGDASAAVAAVPVVTRAGSASHTSVKRVPSSTSTGPPSPKAVPPSQTPPVMRDPSTSAVGSAEAAEHTGSAVKPARPALTAASSLRPGASAGMAKPTGGATRAGLFGGASPSSHPSVTWRLATYHVY